MRRIFALAWALAGVSALVGGMLLANITGVSLDLKTFGLLVFPVVILGGLDSVPGHHRRRRRDRPAQPVQRRATSTRASLSSDHRHSGARSRTSRWC